MKYQIDHDYHIHSGLSLCSDDPEQTPQAILEYGEQNQMKRLVLTDHYWDEEVPGAEDFSFYREQDTERIYRAYPLPQGEHTRFFWGCEIDMSKDFRIGLTREHFDRFDFVIIPITHLHLKPFTVEETLEGTEARAKLYVERWDALLKMDIPFEKVGFAHLTCSLIDNSKKQFEDHLRVLDRIPDEEFRRLFTRSKEVGMGIELNFPIENYSGDDLSRVLRPYQIAKEVGCKFYLGSDAHHKEGLAQMERFAQIVEALQLTEEDKFHFPAEMQ